MMGAPAADRPVGSPGSGGRRIGRVPGAATVGPLTTGVMNRSIHSLTAGGMVPQFEKRSAFGPVFIPGVGALGPAAGVAPGTPGGPPGIPGGPPGTPAGSQADVELRPGCCHGV